MGLVDKVYFKISLFSIVYIGVLVLVAPIIDNLFTSLEEDKEKQENNIQIFFEIISQLILISLVWYYLHNFLKKTIETKLNIKIKSATEYTINFISSIAFVGLQKNLLDKLEYIAIIHPFQLN